MKKTETWKRLKRGKRKKYQYCHTSDFCKNLQNIEVCCGIETCYYIQSTRLWEKGWGKNQIGIINSELLICVYKYCLFWWIAIYRLHSSVLFFSWVVHNDRQISVRRPGETSRSFWKNHFHLAFIYLFPVKAERQRERQRQKEREKGRKQGGKKRDELFQTKLTFFTARDLWYLIVI